MQTQLHDLELPVQQRLRSFAGEDFARRLWNRDTSLFSADTAEQAQIGNSLGWLTVPERMKSEIQALMSFRSEIEGDRFTDVVLIGMGGSSLCPDLFRLTFPQKGGVRLHVLDSTDPDQIEGLEKRLDLKRTLTIIASKSGTTIEVDSLHEYFFDKVKDGSAFAAITDAGTMLEKLAKERRYRKIFVNPSDIGGRYSALSFFGLVPAALLGMDLEKLLRSALLTSVACGPTIRPTDNVAFALGAFLGEAALRGRDKLTLLLSPELSAFGAWIEQLVAESTGKKGVGIVPIDGEPPDAAIDPSDRLVVAVRLDSGRNEYLDHRLAQFADLRCPSAVIGLSDLYDLGGEFLRWEIATAVAGYVLRINPFDQPNVQESKTLTKKRLEAFRATGRLEEPPHLVREPDAAAWADSALGKASGCEEALRAHIRRAGAGDYVALLAFLPQTAENGAALGKLRAGVAKATGRATTAGFGPRYLHSTGQLHKGGAPNGLFIEITGSAKAGLPVPGRPYDFRTLEAAQAQGDFEALTTWKRRVLRIHLTGDPERGLGMLTEWLRRNLRE
jgi:glucose-6-phosphate isomerase